MKYTSANFCTITRSCSFQPATLQRVTLLHGCFSRFLNCTDGTKSRKALQMHISIYQKHIDQLDVT